MINLEVNLSIKDTYKLIDFMILYIIKKNYINLFRLYQNLNRIPCRITASIWRFHRQDQGSTPCRDAFCFFYKLEFIEIIIIIF